MKGTIKAKIIVMVIFIWMSIMGTHLNNNYSDTSMVWLNSLISFLIITFIMMILPVCFKIFRRTNINQQEGKKICKWNCVIVLLFLMMIDIIIMKGIYDEVFQNLGQNLVYALMFYYINSRLLFNETSTNVQKRVTFSLSSEEEKDMVDMPIREDSATRKCTDCEKQHFNGHKSGKLLKIILIALLILSLFMNVVLCISTLSLKKELTNWEKYDNSAFETLYFAGEGESTIEDIDAPPGTYSIKCNWEGDGRIVLYDGVDSIGQLVAYGNEKTGLFEGVMISGHIEVKVEGMWTVSIEKID